VVVQGNADSLFRRVIRFANIIICIGAIAYFLSFLGFINVPRSFFGRLWDFVGQTIFLIPQVVILVPILIKEIRNQGTLWRHLSLLLVILSLVAFGLFYTHTLLGAIQS
jgi:hypothetical protein